MNRRFLAILPFLALVGCGGGPPAPGTTGEMAAVAPMMSVERFLQAVNARDYPAMANLFGTQDGPVIDTGGTVGCGFKKFGDWLGMGDSCPTWPQIEQRMDLIAQILTHEDYRIVSENRVAGRTAPTTRIGVNLVLNAEDTITDLPFTVVQTGEGRWLIEQIALERVTSG